MSIKLPFYIQAFVYLGAFLFAFSLREPKIHEQMSKQENPRKNILRIVKYSIHDHKEIKWLILYGAVISTATLSMVWFIQPYAKDVGFPLGRIGLLWAAFNLSVAWFYTLAHGYEKRIGRKRSLISMIIFVFLGFALTGTFYSLRGLAFIFIIYFVRGINSPVITDYINRLVSSNIRATVLSVKALVMRILFAAVGPMLGRFSDLYSLQTALLIS